MASSANESKTTDQNQKKKKRLWLSAALVQLGLMTAGATHVPLNEIPLVGPAVGYYGDLSGASHLYGFFSPGVYSQLQAVIDVYDSKGTKSTQPIEAKANREFFLRINDIFDQFMNEFDDKVKFQRILAASLAGSVFARTPEAEQVGVRIERYTAPSRKAFLEGKRTNWEKVYSAKFVHRSSKAKNSQLSEEAP